MLLLGKNDSTLVPIAGQLDNMHGAAGGVVTGPDETTNASQTTKRSGH